MNIFAACNCIIQARRDQRKAAQAAKREAARNKPIDVEFTVVKDLSPLARKFLKEFEATRVSQ